MMKWLIWKFLVHFDKRRRHIDMISLWPSICEQAPNLDTAKAAFATHIYHDNAWIRHFTADELSTIIDELEWV